MKPVTVVVVVLVTALTSPGTAEGLEFGDAVEVRVMKHNIHDRARFLKGSTVQLGFHSAGLVAFLVR